jgi:hypothetical protein
MTPPPNILPHSSKASPGAVNAGSVPLTLPLLNRRGPFPLVDGLAELPRSLPPPFGGVGSTAISVMLPWDANGPSP